MVGLADLVVPTALAVDEDVLRSRQHRVQAECAEDLLDLTNHTLKDRPLIIAAGGPSLADTFDGEAWQNLDVMATNGTAEWLMRRGVDPRWHVILDGRERVKDYITSYSPPGMVTLIASSVHPAVWRAVQSRPYRAFHTFADAGVTAVGGGPTVGLRAIVLGHILGYRTLLLHGFDSSSDGPTGFQQTLHVYGDRPDHKIDQVVEVHQRQFMTNAELIQQAQNFYPTVDLVERDGTSVYLCGHGLLPTMVQGDNDPSALWGLS